ncbi:hypothetical protein [Abyssibacter profundi]|uniref:hypothetical protein n=1 Tax=Abyssibacter profundi TaxID=2182787 RepID=UPI0014030FF4|nr:hypothetical protein [Abyssibacter profundi]
MRTPVRQSLLQVVAVALLALQWSAATHAADHALEPAHQLCALCHVAQKVTTPPASTGAVGPSQHRAQGDAPLPIAALQRVAWASQALRGPPLYT